MPFVARSEGFLSYTAVPPLVVPGVNWLGTDVGGVGGNSWGGVSLYSS